MNKQEFIDWAKSFLLITEEHIEEFSLDGQTLEQAKMKFSDKHQALFEASWNLRKIHNHPVFNIFIKKGESWWTMDSYNSSCGFEFHDGMKHGNQDYGKSPCTEGPESGTGIGTYGRAIYSCGDGNGCPLFDYTGKKNMCGNCRLDSYGYLFECGGGCGEKVNDFWTQEASPKKISPKDKIPSVSWLDAVDVNINYVKNGVPIGIMAYYGEKCLNIRDDLLHTVELCKEMGLKWNQGEKLENGMRMIFKSSGKDETGNSGNFKANNLIREFKDSIYYTSVIKHGDAVLVLDEGQSGLKYFFENYVDTKTPGWRRIYPFGDE